MLSVRSGNYQEVDFVDLLVRAKIEFIFLYLSPDIVLLQRLCLENRSGLKALNDFLKNDE